MKATGLVFAERPHKGLVTPTTFEDISRYKTAITGAGTPTWTRYNNGLWLRTYNGTSQYHYVDDAATRFLDFTTGNYSLTCWINWIDTTNSLNIAGRYVLDANGWELYLYNSAGTRILTQRHHHSLITVDTHERTASYSAGWTDGVPMMIAIVYTGDATDGIHYRNGVALAVTSSAGGLRAPESSANDLVIGARYSKTADWYSGQTGLLNIWNRALSAEDVAALFQKERHYFGV